MAQCLKIKNGTSWRKGCRPLDWGWSCERCKFKSVLCHGTIILPLCHPSIFKYFCLYTEKIRFHEHIYDTDFKLHQKSTANLRVSSINIFHTSSSNYKQLVETLFMYLWHLPFHTNTNTHIYTDIAPGSSLCLSHEPGCKGIWHRRSLETPQGPQPTPISQAAARNLASHHKTLASNEDMYTPLFAVLPHINSIIANDENKRRAVALKWNKHQNKTH